MRKRDIQAVLRDSTVDPKKDTSYLFVAELDNPAYCVTKALDILYNVNLSRVTTKASDDAIKQAITLLAMARVQINGCNCTRKANLPSQPENCVDSNMQSPDETTKSPRNKRVSSR